MALTPDPEPVEVDLTAADVPPGEYSAVTHAVTLGVGKFSGFPYYQITFRIEKPDAYAGRLVDDILSFAPRAMRFTVWHLGVIAGGPLPDGTVNLKDPAFQHRFLRRQVRLMIGERLVGLGRREPDVLEILPLTPEEGGTAAE